MYTSHNAHEGIWKQYVKQYVKRSTPPPPTQPEAGSGANCSLLLSGKASCGRKRCPAGGCFVPQVEEVGVEGVRGQRAKGEPKSLVFSLIFY